MKEFISKYNARLSVLNEHVPVDVKQISFDDAKNVHSKIFQTIAKPYLAKATQNASQIPFETKKKIIDLKELEKRCIEEEEMLACECKRLLSNKLSLMKDIKEKVNVLQKKENAFSLGLSSVLSTHSLVLSKQIFCEREAYSSFSIEIPEFCVEPEPEYMVQVWHKQRLGEDTEESEDSSSSSESDEEYIDDNFEY